MLKLLNFNSFIVGYWNKGGVYLLFLLIVICCILGKFNVI